MLEERNLLENQSDKSIQTKIEANPQLDVFQAFFFPLKSTQQDELALRFKECYTFMILEFLFCVPHLYIYI